MNHMKRILALALALALSAALLTGCGGGSSSASSSAPASSSAGAASPSAGDSSAEAAPIEVDLDAITDPYLFVSGLAGDTVVGSVDGMDITAGELLYWLNVQAENYMYQLQYYGVTEMPWTEELEEQMLNGAMDTAAFYRILPEVGQQVGLKLTQEDLDFPANDLAMCIEELGSEEAMTHWLWFRLMVEEQYADLYYGGRYFQMVQEHYFGEGGEFYPTDAEVKAYVEDEMGYYRVKHILISTKDEATGEDLTGDKLEAKTALAEDILAQLRAAEDPIALFDTLMNEHGEDPGVASNPDGYEAYPGQMVAEFEQASLALKDGEISDLVKSDFGYHIILRLPLDLEKYRDGVASIAMDDWIYDLLEERGVTTNEVFDSIDVTETHDKILALQTAAQEELLAIMEQIQAEQGEGDSSQG